VREKVLLKVTDEVINFPCNSNKNNFFKMIYINAQSIANVDHANILRRLLRNKCVDLIAVSETWLSSKNPDKICAVSGYNLVRNDREGLMGGGGVALLIKQPIKYKVLATSPQPFNPKNVEYICCEITLKNSNILVIALYRRPFSDCKFDILFSEMQKLVASYDEVIVLGDFNVNFAVDTQARTDLNTQFDDFDLSRLPIDNTHATKTSLTTIDAIFISAHIEPNSYGKLPNLLSNHEILFVVLDRSHSSDSIEHKFIREFDSINQDVLIEEALQVDWSRSSEIECVDNKVVTFSQMLLEFYDKFLPLKKIKIKREFKPKLPDLINDSIKERDRLRNLAFRAGRQLSIFDNIFDKYREVKNRVKQLISSFHREIIFKKLSNLVYSSQIWNVLRNLGLVKEKSQSSVLPVDLDEMVIGLTKIPDIDLHKIDYNYKLANQPVSEKFYFSYVHPIKIKNALFDISSSAEGTDGICVKMLKLIWLVIWPTLTNIINSSMQMSHFPNTWKQAILCPIPKIKLPLSATDFRPISLLCAMSKVLEKVVHDQILDYLNGLNIMDPLQSGYRKMYSTATALLKVTEDIRLSIFKKEVVLMVFLDYSKAFDCVDHVLLLKKLEQLEFSDSVVKWLKSYLASRECAVRGRGKLSNFVKMQRGVPQGSCLSPLLFSLYTHDISKIFKNRCNYHIYADDIQLYISCKISELNEAVQIMNFILEDIAIWSERHGLKLNPNKTQAMLIASQNTHKQINTQNVTKLSLNGTDINFIDVIKNLGVMFDKNFTWNKQISAVCQKVYGTLNNLNKFRAMTPQCIRLKLIKSLVLPHIDYCCFAYCDINNEQTKRLQSLLNAAIYYVYDVPFAARLTPYFLKAAILKVSERHELEILLMSHKIVHKHCPEYLSDYYKLAKSASSRVTRSHEFMLRTPLVGVEAPADSFTVKSSRLWNKLPVNLCCNQNIDAFKSAIKEDYFKKYEEQLNL
jgi:hypothetical protein